MCDTTMYGTVSVLRDVHNNKDMCGIKTCNVMCSVERYEITVN